MLAMASTSLRSWLCQITAPGAMLATKASPFSTQALPEHGLYRFHLPDPVYFDKALKVTVQQIGAWDHGLFERSDDISTVAYWYQTGEHAPFPVLPPATERWPR